ncbi:Magnesium chelatase subunit D, putative chloroplast precursor [Ectocarpus siliculosus]|uniref:Mg-protoporphyrin IX chelatase n=1 Tax=Ectocarpus siliculosus TaxID=2880 RepID=D7G476_ECTSI|nr:Magnesium chelatase subunit D, putative chloroplast precursor [Ectocarpus siliculosus]|eukprot:CBJ27091.1 Magnesium chelatase subunit D, putative chloroplast precursor [Ectocarpus siliculosus]
MQPVKMPTRPYPMSKIVGQDMVKLALLLAAVNPAMGGVLISGSRGTAKSILARAIHSVLPPIERIKDSAYNLDPEAPNMVDDFTAAMLEREGKELSDLETEIVDAPFVQVPLNVMEDRLLGSVDVEESVKQGKTVFLPGLLATAHRGILYVDDINLLDTELCQILLGIVSDGWVNVEREGISMRYPCKPLMIATFNPEEAELRDHLLDRIAVALSVDAAPLDMDQRIEAVNGVLEWADIDEADLQSILDEEDNVKTRIIFAREELKQLQLSKDQIKYLCEEASRAQTQGQRAEIFACEVARASAALEDRRVSAEDLKLAVKLAIAPRGIFMQMPQDDEEMLEPPPPPPPPPQNNQEDDENGEEEKDEDEEPEEEESPEEEEQEEDQPDEDEAPAIPQEFMFDIDSTPIDPELLDFTGKNNLGKSGGRGLIYSQERGRYIKPMIPRGKVTRLAVDATMRAAAPYQRPRRKRAAGTERETRGVFIEGSDVRAKRMARKAGSLIIFIVDASGSMALNRMNAAKGAAMSLLQEAYQSRDKICIIPFQGDKAEVLLPPTKSIAMARRRLETMPCGGGSPLAHALNVAVRTGINAQKSGDVGKVIMVCISDGRANVPLSVSNGEPMDPDNKPTREELKDEVIKVSKGLVGLGGFNLVMLDTENKFVSTGMAKEIAAAAGGRYHYIPKASEQAIASVASQAMEGL